MQKTIFFLVVTTLLFTCCFAQCPYVDDTSADPGCFNCLSDPGCYFGEVTGVGVNRYCCQNNTGVCAGVVSGGSTSYKIGDPRLYCNCPLQSVSGSFEFLPNIPPTNGSYGFLSYGVIAGPGTFEAYPTSPGSNVEVFVIGLTSPVVQCAAYNPSDVGDPTINVTKTGTFRQVKLPAGNFVITVRTQSTGITDTSPYQVNLRYCATSCATPVCGGTCNLNTQWCSFAGSCTGSCPSGQNMLYICCPIGKPSTDIGCTSPAVMIQVSIISMIIFIFFM